MTGAVIDDEARCPACNRAYPAHQRFCADDGARLIRIRARRDALVGTILDGRYRIDERIGEGGMGLVYRGVQLSVDRPVAIKVIRHDLVDDRATARRFLREARMTTFNHPNIVHIFELGHAESGALYLVMELLRGRTLEAELRHGAFTTRRACEVAIQLCDALAAAHARGVVHRDLKPANIMLLDDPAVRDLVKVLDFGLAKSLRADMTATSQLTLAGAILGTPWYLAPEAISGDAIDARSDLYALGCILHEMLAGVAPYADRAVHVVLARHMADEPPPLPHVPAPLAALVASLLAKSPSDRPPTAGHVRAALQPFLADAAFEDDDEAATVVEPRRRFPTGSAPPPAPLSVAVAAPAPAPALPVAPASRLRFALLALAIVLCSFATALIVIYA